MGLGHYSYIYCSLIISNIPWKVTNSVINGHSKIIEIYNWVINPENNSIIREFILANCNEFVLPVHEENPQFFGKPDTGISVNSFNLNYLLIIMVKKEY